MLLDINTCTSRQLTGLPGIDRRLADNIARYRHDRGRFQHIEDLWKVSGINRTKFQLLKRHFKVRIEQRADPGLRLSLARLPLTNSMMDLMCKGESVTNKPCQVTAQSSTIISRPLNIPHCEAVKTATGATRSGRRYRLPSDTETRTRAKHRPSRSQGSGVSWRKTPVMPPSTSTDKKAATEKQGSQKCSENKLPEKACVETLKASAPVPPIEDATGPAETASHKPAFTLKTSPSGNNINFSCTIDKRLLGQPTSLAFKFENNMPGVFSNRYNKPVTAGAGTSAGGPLPPEKDSREADRSASEDYVTAVAAHPTAPLRNFVNQAELPSIGGSQRTRSSSSSLTEENVLLYERKHTPGVKEKKRTIEAWVDEVNDARNVGRLLKARARESPARGIRFLREERARQDLERKQDAGLRGIDRRARETPPNKGKDCPGCSRPTKASHRGHRHRDAAPVGEDADAGPSKPAPQGGEKRAKPTTPANTPRDGRPARGNPPPDAQDVADALDKVARPRGTEKRSRVSNSSSSSSVLSVPKRAVMSQADRINYLRNQRRVIERHPRKHGGRKTQLLTQDKPNRSESDIVEGRDAAGAARADAARDDAARACVPDGRDEPLKKLTHPSRKYHHNRKRHGYDRYGRRYERYNNHDEEACKVM